MKPGWIVLIALIVILLVLFVIIIDWMTRYAYDRKSPKLPKFLVNIFMGNRPMDEEERQKIREQAASLKENADQTLFMTSYDGETMAGHYYPCENAKRIVIACHIEMTPTVPHLGPLITVGRSTVFIPLGDTAIGCGTDAWHDDTVSRTDGAWTWLVVVVDDVHIHTFATEATFARPVIEDIVAHINTFIGLSVWTWIETWSTVSMMGYQIVGECSS